METISAVPRTPQGKSMPNERRSKPEKIPKEERDDVVCASHIRDEHVQVNLAMADLMAYLQVVANNSNNLPMTRRDDPDLDRMTSSLTNEEYARKSAAFIPADVRVIGGSFTKYGRVWDLPTSDEYNAEDGAQEPGRSYGGACSNAMLKVLYDAANEAADATQTMQASEALFEDDDDEDASLTNGPAFTRDTTFSSLGPNGHSNPSTITWATMMRKMKAEIKEIEYAQVPVLTSTRKFDLNQPFSLTPESFDSKCGKRRSLLVGCNYGNVSGAQLKASHDDVRSMKDYIVNVHGFPESSDMMTILIDDDEHRAPTFLNIIEAFKALSEQSQPGDAVFIHFSGHGGRVLEAESYDEVVVPGDYTTSGLIRDTLIFKTLLAPMRYGVTVTILIDACDTGMVLDLPYSWSTRADRAGAKAKLTQNDDFSFVRFLKVVKTLYESSAFTQLGNLVGSALNTGNLQSAIDTDEDDTDENSMVAKDTPLTDLDTQVEEQVEEQVGEQVGEQVVDLLSSMFNMCGSPTGKDETSNQGKKKGGGGYMTLEIDTNDIRLPASLLEQIVNCTRGVEEVEDLLCAEDEVFHKSRDVRYSELDSYSSYDDDAYRSKKKRGKRGRSRRRRK